MDKIACILTIALGLLVPYCFGKATIKFPPPESNAKYLGTGGGASFFTEPTKRHWFEAKDYCSSYGMLLAWIKTPEQELFLRSLVTNNNPDFRDTYWTSGSDLTTSPDRFGWYGTFEMTRSHILFSRQDYPTSMCVQMRPTFNNGYPGYYASLCTNTAASLCQINN